MKMLIEKKILLEGLNAVSRALSTRNIIPVLNGIKFDLKKEGLIVSIKIDKSFNKLSSLYSLRHFI